MFSIAYLKYKKTMFGMCMCFFLSNEKNVILLKEKEKKKRIKWWARRRKKKFSLVNGSHDF